MLTYEECTSVYGAVVINCLAGMRRHVHDPPLLIAGENVIPGLLSRRFRYTEKNVLTCACETDVLTHGSTRAALATLRYNFVQMIMAKVLVGEFAVGDHTMERPPTMVAQGDRTYDSTSNHSFSPSIIVSVMSIHPWLLSE